MTKRAEQMKLEGVKLSKMDYKFFFFPWWKERRYRLEGEGVVEDSLRKYFEGLKGQGIELDRGQQLWYSKKADELGEAIYKEYPSTPKEAFQASDNDKVYLDSLNWIFKNNRITEFEVDDLIEVDCDWDLGRDDYTAVIFSQVVGKELRVVDYLEGWPSG